jgi:WD40 repeat protein
MRAWSFLADGQGILALDEQGRVARWQGADFQHSQPLMELETNAVATCFSPDGQLMAAASPEGKIRVWSLQHGELLRAVTPAEGWGLPVVFLSSSNHLVTQQPRSGTFREWDVTTGREIRRWQSTAPSIPWKSAFSPDGQWIAAANGEGAAQLHHLITGQDTRLDLNLKQVAGAAFSPNGQWFAVVSALGIGQLWNTTTAQQLATLQGFLQGTHSVAFSPDGKRLAIGSNGNEAIKLWDVESLQELLTLNGQGSMFNSTAFSQDGNVLASCNSQGILHIWRAPSFKEIARLDAQGR